MDVGKVKGWLQLARPPVNARKYEKTEFEESVKVAIEAVEKQVPKKPVYDCKSTPFRCPSCMLVLDAVVGQKTSYCIRCGQAIDWKGVLYDV